MAAVSFLLHNKHQSLCHHHSPGRCTDVVLPSDDVRHGDVSMAVQHMHHRIPRLWLHRAVGIDVEERTVKISKKEHMAPGYLAVNPLGKLPCLQVAHLQGPRQPQIPSIQSAQLHKSAPLSQFTCDRDLRDTRTW